MYQRHFEIRSVSGIRFRNNVADFVHQTFNQESICESGWVRFGFGNFLNKKIEIDAIGDHGQRVGRFTENRKQRLGELDLFLLCPTTKFSNEGAAIGGMIPGYDPLACFRKLFVLLRDYVIPIRLEKSPVSSLANQA